MIDVYRTKATTFATRTMGDLAGWLRDVWGGLTYAAIWFRRRGGWLTALVWLIAITGVLTWARTGSDQSLLMAILTTMAGFMLRSSGTRELRHRQGWFMTQAEHYRKENARIRDLVSQATKTAIQDDGLTRAEVLNLNRDVSFRLRSDRYGKVGS